MQNTRSTICAVNSCECITPFPLLKTKNHHHHVVTHWIFFMAYLIWYLTSFYIYCHLFTLHSYLSFVTSFLRIQWNCRRNTGVWPNISTQNKDTFYARPKLFAFDFICFASKRKTFFKKCFYKCNIHIHWKYDFHFLWISILSQWKHLLTWKRRINKVSVGSMFWFTLNSLKWEIDWSIDCCCCSPIPFKSPTINQKTPNKIICINGRKIMNTFQKLMFDCLLSLLHHDKWCRDVYGFIPIWLWKIHNSCGLSLSLVSFLSVCNVHVLFVSICPNGCRKTCTILALFIYKAIIKK